MKRRNAVHIFRGITIVILSIAVAAVIVMLLCRILFKGFGFPHPANTFRFNKEHIEMHDRMKHMTWDEKRAYIRSRMAKFHEQEAHE